MANRAVLALASGAQEQLLCAALASQGVTATAVPPSAHLETEIMRALHSAESAPLIVFDLAVLAQLATSVSAFCSWKRDHCSAAPLVLYCSALHTVHSIERAWAQSLGALDLVADCTGWLRRKPLAPVLRQLLAAVGVAHGDAAKLGRALDALPAGHRAAVTAESLLAVFEQLDITPEALVAGLRRGGGIPISDHLYRLKTYQECFVGSAAVEWIARKLGLAGFPLFQEHGPGHWGTPGTARLTLFQLVTLEGWGEFVQTAMKTHAWSWIYFVCFILFGTFLMRSLFIAVVFINLEASKNAELEVLPVVPAGR